MPSGEEENKISTGSAADEFRVAAALVAELTTMLEVFAFLLGGFVTDLIAIFLQSTSRLHLIFPNRFFTRFVRHIKLFGSCFICRSFYKAANQ